MTESRAKADSKDLTPPDTIVEGGGAIEASSQVEALKKLQKLVDDDPNTTAVLRKMSLVFQVRQWLSLAGNFPTGVSYYAIAAILSGVIWTSDTQIANPELLIGGILSSALAGQIIEKVGKNS